MNDVKIFLGNRGMTVEAVRNDKKGWKALVHMLMIEFNAAIFAWYNVLLDHPHTLWWIITWRGVG